MVMEAGSEQRSAFLWCARIALSGVLLGVGSWWTMEGGVASAQGQRSRPYTLKLPQGVLDPIIPEDNPLSEEKVGLGKALYFDTRLSVDDTVSCATCHDPKFGFADGKKVAEGIQKKKGARNSPTTLNTAFLETQFWDGRAPTLETVIEFYDKGGVPNPNLDGGMRPLGLGEQEKKDLVEFLKVLSSDDLPRLGAAATPAPLGRSDPVSTDYNHTLERRQP
jgi:hypothetical protein